MQLLSDISEDDYAPLLHSGMLFELYPMATGDYKIDSLKPDILNNWYLKKESPHAS